MVDFAEVNGAKIAYEKAGTGPPLLLLHGAEGSRRSFDKIVPELSARFTVISYDQRDCGETENPSEPASLAMLANDAKALIESLGYSKAYVFGTSFGGRLAQALAIHHPDVIVRLILASTWPLPQSLMEFNRDVATEMVTLRAGLPGSAERLAEYFFPLAFLQTHPEYKGYFKSAKPRSDRSARRAQTVSEHPPLDVGGISAKTLMVAGELDALVPAQLTLAMKHHIRDSEAVTLAGVGHIACIQAPKQVAGHIREFCA